MNNVRETINTMLVKTFHEILELEEKAIITDEFSDISNNDMHIIEAIGLGEGARMMFFQKPYQTYPMMVNCKRMTSFCSVMLMYY